MDSADRREFKNRVYEQFARITKALGSTRRLEIVDLLAQGERTVESLAAATDMSVANASQHLQTLKAAQLVESRREGQYAYYRLADDNVFDVWRAIRRLGEARLADLERVVESFLHDRGDLEELGMEELAARLHDRHTVLLDVRPADEYRAGHLPGALSIPIEELSERLAELPDDARVVAYCRGPYCVFADEAVTLLRRHGVAAQRLREGFPDWRAAGLPTE